eukprot:TRINITY_DN18565_c0_g1_i1.p1 TRINITY_DN18565_c0_g1~~TRINITY_DN18565_c0_g1_i1.p1  ORF type:complete len:301 (-),score=33.50 TRINITY_DN18565_c0_g1_i1:311-1213(-)
MGKKRQIEIFYVERSMQFSLEIEESQELDERTVRRLVTMAGQKIAERLGVPYNDTEWVAAVNRLADDKIFMSLTKEASAKGWQLQCLLARQKEHQMQKLCSEKASKKAETSDGCEDRAKLRGELNRVKGQLQTADSRIDALEERTQQRDASIEEMEKRWKEESENLLTAMAKLQKESTDFIKSLSGSVFMAEQIRRRILLDDARTEVLQRLDAELPTETWHSFVSSLTEAQRTVVGLSDDALDLLATGKTTLNRVAHRVDSIDLVADAVLKVTTRRDAWCTLFQYTYGEDPNQLVFRDAD